MTWHESDLNTFAGKRVIITGATSGLGFETALRFATVGAQLLVTARDDRKAAILETALAAVTTNKAEFVPLDLADLSSVHSAADALVASGDPIDVLINNAGIMIPPYAETVDGYELQIGTNHLGHFAWTARLWPILSAARVVTLASLAHTAVNSIDLDSLTPQGAQRSYRPWRSYAESKLANLLFSSELNRRIQNSGGTAVSVAAHPGVSATSLMTTGPALAGENLVSRAVTLGGRLIGQAPEFGVLPTLMAASDQSLQGDEYIGPDGFRQFRGKPKKVGRTAAARNEELAAALWQASEKATETSFNFARN